MLQVLYTGRVLLERLPSMQIKYNDEDKVPQISPNMYWTRVVLDYGRAEKKVRVIFQKHFKI